MSISDIPERLRKLEPFWGEWRVGSFLGSGTYSRVYKIYKQDNAGEYFAALKWIPIPADPDSVTSLLQDGITDLKSYFADVARKANEEIKVMDKLSGNSFIVDYRDHMIIERRGEGEYGCDILIRMELLTSLNSFLAAEQLTYADVIKLSMDMTRALAVCKDNGLIHRDVKAANVFRTQNGDFKLGDFGISRSAENASMTRGIGTIDYMAPELYLNSNYDYTVDEYSLGILLYRLLNRMRVPFIDTGAKPTQDDLENARKCRFYNERELPPPGYDDIGLWSVIKRMCAHEPRQRYLDLNELWNELDKFTRVININSPIYPGGERIQLDAISGVTPGRVGNAAVIEGDGGTVNVGYDKPDIKPDIQGTSPVPHSPDLAPTEPPAEKPIKEIPPNIAADEPTAKPRGGKLRVMLIIAGIIVACAACAILLGVLSRGGGVTNLAIYHNADGVILRWSDNDKGPWKVYLTADGREGSQRVADCAARELLLHSLIPGINYQVRVENADTRESVTKALFVEHAERAPTSLYRQYAGRLMSFSRDALSKDFDYSQGVDGKLMRIEEEPEIILSNKPVMSQRRGYIYQALFDYVGAPEIEPLKVRLVLRYADNFAWQISTECDRAGGMCYIYFDPLFADMWDELGAWKDGDATLEVYLDGMLYSEKQVSVTVSHQ